MIIVNACELCGYTGTIEVRQLAPHRKLTRLSRVGITIELAYDVL